MSKDALLRASEMLVLAAQMDYQGLEFYRAHVINCSWESYRLKDTLKQNPPSNES